MVAHDRALLDHLAADFADLGVPVVRNPRWLRLGRPTGDLVVTAHVDRHGLIGTGAAEFRYAAFVLRAGERPFRAGKAFQGTVCTRIADETVIAYDPRTGASLGQAQVRHVCEPSRDLVFTIPGFAALPPGTPAGMAPGCRRDGGTITGQRDNAISVAVLHDLYRWGWLGTAVLTTEEESGRSRRYLLDALSGVPRGRRLLALDTSPFDDRAAAEASLVVLRNRGAGGSFGAATVAAPQAACRRRGVPYLMKDVWIHAVSRRAGRTPRLGRTELGRVVAETDGEWTGASLQLPTFGYHTNEGMTTPRAVANLIAALEELVAS